MALSQVRQLSLCLLPYSSSSGISTVSRRRNAYSLLTDPNRQFMRPRISSGVEKGLHHLPRETPGFPIRNPFYTGHHILPYYWMSTDSILTFHSVSHRSAAYFRRVPLTNSVNEYPGELCISTLYPGVTSLPPSGEYDLANAQVQCPDSESALYMSSQTTRNVSADKTSPRQLSAAPPIMRPIISILAELARTPLHSPWGVAPGGNAI